MPRLETVTPETLHELTGADAAVLVLGRTTCAPCAQWAAALAHHLATTPEAFPGVRFGKLLLDQRGFAGFKRSNPWLAGVTELPYHVIYRRGELATRYAGGGLERLSRRLEAVL